MKTQTAIEPAFDITSAILTVRGEAVLLDMDLARIYGVPTKRLNEQVKRNLARFPDDFAFQLTPAEKAEVVANCDHLRRLKFSPVLPYAFTEQGAIMAASVLNSPQAVCDLPSEIKRSVAHRPPGRPRSRHRGRAPAPHAPARSAARTGAASPANRLVPQAGCESTGAAKGSKR